MRFRAGVLGVVVIILAITGTLLASWTMSLDVEEEQVIRYNPLTEITGLFESEQTPTFTEYNPTTNYTGYYTDGSVIGSTRYFDGVKFGESQRPNNYRVELTPESVQNGTIALNLDTVSGRSVQFADPSAPGTNGRIYKTAGAHTSTLSSLLSAVGAEGSDLITFASDSNADEVVNSVTGISDFGWVVFWVPTQAMPNTINGAASGYTMYIGTPQAVQSQPHPSARIYAPCISASVDLQLNTATLFTDNTLENAAGVVSISDVLVTWGSWPNPNPAVNFIDLQDSLDYTKLRFQPLTYMDPSKGVELS